MKTARRGLLCSLAFSLLAAQTAGGATLKADYEFGGTRASTVQPADPLTDIGPGTNVFVNENVGGQFKQVLAFPQGNGLEMKDARVRIPSGGVYSLVFDVRLEEIDGFKRYVDFSGGTSDNGFYNLSGEINLFPSNTPANPGVILKNTYQRIALTRDSAGVVMGYVEGVQAFGPGDDSTNEYAVIAPEPGSLRFFKDDDAFGEEESAGAVSRIRVYDGALTGDEVAALGAIGQAPSPPPPPPPSPSQHTLPPPTVGKAVNVAPVKGEVFVSVPAGAGRARTSQRSVPGLKGRRFVPLSEARQIPVGSLLDTRRGTVRVVTATHRQGVTQTGDFLGGVFQTLQSRKSKAKGLTELRLKGSSFRRCRTTKGSQAQSALSRRRIRRLRGSGRGRFRTRGRHSSATVRGTDWTVIDRCDGTLTKVRRGKVAVRDFRRKKTIVLKRGKSYLAKARR